MGNNSFFLHFPTSMLLLLGILASLCGLINCNQSPNIIIALIDDAGWNDFENHDRNMETPNIEALRKESLFLNQSYSYPSCVPSRAALLSGRYAHYMGTQDDVISGNFKSWVDERIPLLPAELKKLDYRTHMLGKWHLGFCHPGLTPPLRGFDTFYGFWGGSHDSYYTHYKGSSYDWKDGNASDWTAQGNYQTDLINDRAEKIILESDPKQPFFMYLSWGAVHGPFDVPPKRYVDRYCTRITDLERRIHCVMTAVVDKGLGMVVKALKDKGMYDNTLILFMSDNGGPVPDGGANNWPLRGGKKGAYEGGIRVYTMVKVPGMAADNTVWPGLTHSVDWLPTLVKAAGGQVPPSAHGFNLLPQLRRNELPSPREFLIYADDYPIFNYSAIRYQQWKLFGPVPGLDANSQWKPSHKPGWYPPYQLIEDGSAQIEDDVKEKFDQDEYLLFNIETDPSERNNLAKDPAYKKTVASLQKRLDYLLETFPLAHTRSNEEMEVGISEANEELVTCWCSPPGLTQLDYLCPHTDRAGK